MRNLQILLVIFSLVIHLNLAEEQLSHVQVLFRHGDREAEKGEKGRRDLGPLTDLGKKQMYDLGIFLRRRYPDLIQNEFKSTETFILSSDKDRTIMSASQVAYGLYSNCNEHTELNESLHLGSYCPIPVRGIPAEIDRFIQQSYNCPRHTELFNEIVARGHGPEFFQVMHTFVNRFVYETGNIIPFNTNLSYFERMYAIGLYEEQVRYNLSLNLPIEDWAQEYLTNDRLISLKTNFLQIMLTTREMQRMFAGSMLGLLLDNFQIQSNKAKKLTLYSGHDQIIYVLMVTLGVWDFNVKQMSPSASALIFAVYGQEEKYFQMWYKEGTSEKLKLLEIPNCGFNCSVLTFQKLFGDLVPTDYEKECNLPKSNKV